MDETPFAPSLEAWPRSGSMRNGSLYRQPPLALPTDALACSSSDAWPTPDANAMNDGESTETFEARRQANKAKHNNGNGMGTPLAMAAQMWPTPDAYPRGGAQEPAKRQAGGHKTDLQDAVTGWATPAGRDYRDPSARSRAEGSGRPLNGMAAQWQTPGTDSFRGRGGDRKDEAGLDRRARMWATPQSADGERESETLFRGETNPTLLGQSRSFLQGQLSGSDGQPSSPSGQTSRLRLNTAFVEWLMSIPPRWVIPFAQTPLERSATESYLCALQSRFESCGNG